jgi:hypothetical protein
LYRVLGDVAKGFHQKYVHFQPWVLVAVLLWAALHDRPVHWACAAEHWAGTKLRPPCLPSHSTLSRRLDRLVVGAFLRAVAERLQGLGTPGLRLLSLLDGKPLPVGGCSKDPDARVGRAAGMKAKGYKLHTLWAAGAALPAAWEVTPLNEAESVVAERLFAQAPGAGYALADGNYDSSPLFDTAATAGYQLVVPIEHPSAGKGHHYQSPHRLRCIERVRGEFGRSLYAQRRRIEQSYGNAVSFGGGLGPLPAWVRGRERVRSWAWAKLLINAARILKKQGLTSRLHNVVALGACMGRYRPPAPKPCA